MQTPSKDKDITSTSKAYENSNVPISSDEMECTLDSKSNNDDIDASFKVEIEMDSDGEETMEYNVLFSLGDQPPLGRHTT